MERSSMGQSMCLDRGLDILGDIQFMSQDILGYRGDIFWLTSGYLSIQKSLPHMSCFCNSSSKMYVRVALINGPISKTESSQQ